MSRESTQTRHYSPASQLRWALVALLGLCAVALAVMLATPPRATGQVVSGRRDGQVFAVPAQVGPDAYGLYLIDSGNDTICVYEYTPGRGSVSPQLRLTAARRYSFDMRLEDYNTQPSPREIRELVEQHRRMEEASSGE